MDNSETPTIKPKKKRTRLMLLFIVIGALFLIGWILVRPGVFTVQPIGALPEGVTIVYHSRNPEMPFFHPQIVYVLNSKVLSLFFVV